MADDSFWIERAQSAEAKLLTMQDSMERVRDDARKVLEVFAARKKPDGSYHIDFEKLVEQLGLEQAFELRQVIDAKYQISGAPGEKPRIKAIG